MSFQPPAAATSAVGRSFLLVAQARRYACHSEPSSLGSPAASPSSESIAQLAQIPATILRVFFLLETSSTICCLNFAGYSRLAFPIVHLLSQRVKCPRKPVQLRTLHPFADAGLSRPAKDQSHRVGTTAKKTVSVGGTGQTVESPLSARTQVWRAQTGQPSSI